MHTNDQAWARRRAARRVARLTRALAETTRSEDARDLLAALVDDALSLTGAERGLVLLDDGNGALRACTARDREGRTLEDGARYSTSIANRVFRSGKPLMLLDGGDDWDPANGLSVLELRLRHVLCAPLRNGRRIVGVLYADSKASYDGFAGSELEVFSALGAQCVLALERAELKRMEHEMREARDLQRAMMPPRTVSGLSVEIAGFSRPRDQTGGDYFDYIQLDPHRLAVVMADASGHGMAAALCMSAARSLLRTILPRVDDPHTVLDELNRALSRDMPHGTFMSLFLGELDTRSGGLRYASAGHAAVVYRAGGGRFDELSPTGPALAMIDDAPFQTARATPLAVGDLLLLYTDGIPEARSPHHELFGMDRLKQTLAACRSRSASEIVATISREVATFAGAEGPADDLSLVVAKGRAA